MKKIYATLFAGLFISQMSAQLTMTKASHEPAVGDANTSASYDSSGVVPKSTGSNQVWNFNGYTNNGNAGGSTFVNPAATPSASAYPNSNLAEDQGGGSYTYYRIVTTPTTQLEILGFASPQISMNYTNPAIAAIWPISMGSVINDTYAGTVSGSFSGTMSGTLATTASGNGTVILPNGTSMSNVLQVRTVNTLTANLMGGFMTATIQGTDYNYYHSSQKFPIMTVAYQKQTLSSFGSPTVSTSADITSYTQVIAGINELNFDATFQIFPNPAKDAFNVKLNNSSKENGTMTIYNHLGQAVREIALGNAAILETTVNISGLAPGVYIVKTNLGDRQSARRLVVE